MNASEHDGRRRRSRQSRARIVDAATRLFLERGYGATTIDDIASAAGVAVQTVYYVFGTKRSVLECVLDASIAGDDDTVPVIDQPWVDELGKIADPAAAIDHLMGACVAILARTAPVYGVVSRAATDPEIGELYIKNRRKRRADQRALLEVLGRSGHLGSDLDTAADVFYALVNEETYLLLVDDCGWDLARFRDWLTRTVRAQLVDA